MPEREMDDQMRAHFDQRAGEYDDWWLGTGSFAERDRPGWSAEVEQLIGVVRALPPARVLDVACGTGFLTQHLRGELVALDQSARMVEIAAARMPHARVLRGMSHRCRSATASSTGSSPAISSTTCRLTDAPRSSPRPAASDASSSSSRMCVARTLPRRSRMSQSSSDGSRHRMGRHSFTAAELVSELGAGHVLHEGRWFVAVAS